MITSKNKEKSELGKLGRKSSEADISYDLVWTANHLVCLKDLFPPISKHLRFNMKSYKIYINTNPH